MKTLILSLAILSLAGVSSAQSFNEAAISREVATNQLQFIVPEEASIHYDLLEGSRDSLHFDIAGRIDSGGNRVMPQSYSADSYDASHRYYQIRQADMSAACKDSICISAKKPSAPPVAPPPAKPQEVIISSAPCTSISTVCGR